MSVYDLHRITRFRVEYGKSSLLKGEAPRSSAFAANDTLTLQVRVPRALCAASVELELYRDDDMSSRSMIASLADFTHSTDVFEVTLRLSHICCDTTGGLFYYTFAIDTPSGRVYTNRDGGITAQRNSVSSAQLTVYEAGTHVSKRLRGSVMYQIFVDRFFDGGCPVSPDEGKVINPDWENGVPEYADRPGGYLANNEFFGGNLWGVAKKLDYLQTLGVDTLYLCPIFEAASNHKYDTGDYMKIDRMFGGEAAFDHLVSECKARKMKLILDGVFNHTGSDSRYFNKNGSYIGSGAYNSESSEYYKWYSFDEYPDKYRSWWGIDILPAINTADESYREFICGENGVVRHYLRRGIDGWRLDVADELSDVFLDDLKAAARAEDPDAVIIGEVWEDASNKIAYDRRRRYFRGAQLDGVMNYPLKEAIINFILSGNSTRLVNTARELWAHYPEDVSHSLMNFLGTHDTERILTVLSNAKTHEMTNHELATFRLNTRQKKIATARLEIAWALLAAFPGIPCIYYGDEVGMEGGRDPFNRMPYPWGRENEEIREFYKKIGNIRRSDPIFANGDLEMIDTCDPSKLLFARNYEGRRLIVAANLGESSWEIEFEEAPHALIDVRECERIVKLDGRMVEYFIL